MKKIIYTLLLCGLVLTGCKEETNGPKWWEIEDPQSETPTTDPTTSTAKPRYVWIDAAANFVYLANNEDSIQFYLKKIKDCGFTDVIVDVRPTTGDILYKSATGDACEKVDAWIPNYQWVKRTANFDYLQAFIDKGHALGLRVNASVNTFVGGYLCPYNLGKIGLLFRDNTKREWATVINASKGLTNVMDLTDDETDYGAKFFNPANPEVQDYVLTLLADLAKYNLDGIVLDRCRYDDYNLMSDFSDISRAKFEQYIGASVENFPADIQPAGTDTKLNTSTKWYKQWLAFRVKTIHDFIVRARDTIKLTNDTTRFGTYVGAWYSSYYLSGVNWASPKYNVTQSYSWATNDYKNAGYADHLDFIFLGCYASTTSIYGTDEWSVQGFCTKGKEKLKGDVPFCGGPDIGNGTGWPGGGQHDALSNAIDVCLNNSDGVFLFDLCHIRMYNYWNTIKTAINKYVEANEEK